MVNKCFDFVRSILYPPTCVLCGAPGNDQLDLCASCMEALPVNQNCCPRCALPLPDSARGAMQPCGVCVRQAPVFDRCIAPLLYSPPVDHLIGELKFHQRLVFGRVLGALLQQKLELLPPAQFPELIIPVPLHRLRLKQRGYNQALELARPLSRALGIPLDHKNCRRTRFTISQSSLEKSRRNTNIGGAFQLARPLDVDHVAVVDDVVTTGATVSELARILKRGGIKRVQVWAVARTP